VNIEIAFVVSVWAVAFLICLVSGIPLIAAIFVSSAVAYGLRKLWLRRLIHYNEQLLSGVIAILCILFVVTDRFGIASYALWFIIEHSYFNLLVIPFLYWKFIFGGIPGILWIIGERRILKLEYGVFSEAIILALVALFFLFMLSVLAMVVGTIRSFMSSGKLGRDTPITADLRAREGRAVFYLETDDAGAFLRFTDAYSKVIGGQLQLTIDAPTVEPGPREALLNVGDFTVKGEPSLDMLAADSSAGAQSGISFSRLRAKFIRQNGQLTIRDGILKGPRVGGTIEGDIDYPGNQVRIRGTLAPLYGLNNMFGQVPALGPAGGGGNEGLFGVTYEVVGTPGQPVFRVNPISAMAPSVLRKIFELNKNPNDLPPKN
jgi:hypothetical protein